MRVKMLVKGSRLRGLDCRSAPWYATRNLLLPLTFHYLISGPPSHHLVPIDASVYSALGEAFAMPRGTHLRDAMHSPTQLRTVRRAASCAVRGPLPSNIMFHSSLTLVVREEPMLQGR